MTRPPALVLLLTAFTILCQAAPFNRRASSAAPSSTSTSAPQPSATQQNTTGPNWAAYGAGTTGAALHVLLTKIGPDAPQRWVTVDGISSTQIGGEDPVGSNHDLSAAADNINFGGGESPVGWVETYYKFLIEAGGNTNSTENDELLQESNSTTAAYVAAEQKLVRAYEAAHPGNVTNVGANVTGLPSVQGVTLPDMLQWAWHNGDNHGGDTDCLGNGTSINNTTAVNCTFSSDGPYTAADYETYANASSAYLTLQTRKAGYNNQTQMDLQGYQLKHFFEPKNSGIFNLSMAVGGSGTLTQYAPAWTAEVTGYAFQNLFAFGAQILEGHLQEGLKGPGESTGNTTAPSLGFRKRDGAAGGFNALQALADVHAATKKDPAPQMKVKSAVALTSSDPLDQPVPVNQSFVLLNLIEGSWADKREEYLRTAQQTALNVTQQYFGPGGDLARRWTHLVLRASFESVNGTNATRVSMVDLFGKVYGPTPGYFN